jgi:uncharacterized protein (DUF58 family)
MRYQGSPRGHSKLQHASLLAAALASILIQQRDAVGLVLFDEVAHKNIPPRATPSHYTQLLEELVSIQSRPKTGLGATFHRLAEEIKRRGLVVVFSDLFGDVEDVLGGLKHFRHRRHEVIVFQVLDDDEISFPFHDLTKFVGLELEPELLVDPRGIREEYLREFQQFRSRLERECRESRVDLVPAITSEAPSATLSRYLGSRKGRRGG